MHSLLLRHPRSLSEPLSVQPAPLLRLDPLLPRVVLALGLAGAFPLTAAEPGNTGSTALTPAPEAAPATVSPAPAKGSRPDESGTRTKAYDLLNAPVAYSVPTMEDIILASQFSVPSTTYLDNSRTLLGDIVLSLDILDTEGEFRVVLHLPAKDNPGEVGDEVAEVFRGTPRSLDLTTGNQKQVRFDQKRGLRLPDSEYYVVLHGLSGVSAVAWNVTEQIRAANDAAVEDKSQVIWNPEVHRRLMRKGQLATAMLPDDNPEMAAAANLGGLPLALSAGGAFMMEVTVSQIGTGVVPEPATTAALLGVMALALAVHRRRAVVA